MTRASGLAPSGASVAFASMACADVLVSRMSGVYQSAGYTATPESEREVMGPSLPRRAGLAGRLYPMLQAGRSQVLAAGGGRALW